MPTITFENQSYPCEAGELLLDALTRQGVNLPFGCRAGGCQACMLKATDGDVPALAQTNIEEKLRRKHYFLACLCRPESDMTIALPDPADRYHSAIVFEKVALNAQIIRLRCSLPEGFSYRPGQFVNLTPPDLSITRSYSLASLPEEPFVEFHIRLLPDGRMSRWLAESVNNGDFIFLSDPLGHCYYRNQPRPLLLAGTGTGLAPLYGITRDALGQQHPHAITLLHGALDQQGLYHHDALQTLADAHSNLHYLPVVLHDGAPANGAQGSIQDQFAHQLETLPSTDCDAERQPLIFLCGDTATVAAMRETALAAGIADSLIYTDSFG